MAEEKSEVFRSNAPQEIAINVNVEAKRKKAAEAPEPELRQISDHNATGAAGEREFADVAIKKHADDELLDLPIARHADDTDAVAEIPVVVPPPQSAMIEKDDAIPWALAIHLEERIKNLGSKTAAVNQELDMLEVASQKLAKRIGK